MNKEMELELGLEIVAAMKANCYNQSIEWGRIEAHSDTEVWLMEGMTNEEFKAYDIEHQERLKKFCANEKERMHTQAMFVTKHAIAKYKELLRQNVWKAIGGKGKGYFEICVTADNYEEAVVKFESDYPNLNAKIIERI